MSVGGAGRADAVVAGGGTAGHVIPALAVAEALVAAGHDPQAIHYTGTERGIERTLLPATPFPFTLFDVVGFQRRLSRRNLAFLPKLWKARTAAIGLFEQIRPRVVVSVGGYASMPAVLAARRLKVPVVVVSYDRFPGRASAVAARRAAACAVAFPDSPLPNATLTGAPIRQAVLDVDRWRDRDAARRALGLPLDRFVLAVMGGSQGSGVLNQAVTRFVAEHAGDRQLAVRHATGERFLATAPAEHTGADGIVYQPVGYESQMPLVYAAADLLVGRGGASTVHEVAVTGIPAVLVPWADSAEDHQSANVRWLADQSAAVMLAEDQLGRLGEVIGQLRADPERRATLSAQAAEAGAVHRRGALAALIDSVALT
jgi:UDP-N-acetylglucosamine--N-acetylmuramyl-(pentapeptide) pyrophosphoryl-undecaprenol N-acetylglucosamine transferase